MSTISSSQTNDEVSADAVTVSENLKNRAEQIDRHTPGKVAKRVALFLWDMSQWPQTVNPPFFLVVASHLFQQDVDVIIRFITSFTTVGQYINILGRRDLPNFDLDLFLTAVKPIIDESRPFLHHAPRRLPTLFNHPARLDVNRIQAFNDKLDAVLTKFQSDLTDVETMSTLSSPTASPDRFSTPRPGSNRSTPTRTDGRSSVALSPTGPSMTDNRTRGSVARNNQAAGDILDRNRLQQERAEGLSPPEYAADDHETISSVGTGQVEGAQSPEDTEWLEVLRLPELRVQVRREGQGPAASGGFGDVWRGVTTDNGRPVAIKAFTRLLRPDSLKRTRREIAVWLRMNHRNVLPFLGVFWRSGSSLPDLVSPWKENGNLSEYLKQHSGANRIEMIGGIASGLTHMHNLCIIHDDLKPANILVDDDGTPQIADLGLSAFEEDILQAPETVSHHVYGTFQYMAPERILPGEFGIRSRDSRSKQSDVYSFGMVLYETFAGKIPFPDLITPAAIMHAIMADRRPSHPGKAAIDQGLSLDLWRFLKGCWERLPGSRPSLTELDSVLEQALKEMKLGSGSDT